MSHKPKKTLIIGSCLIFLLTVIYRVVSLEIMLIEMSSMYSYGTLSYILQIACDIIEIAIYASGIALILTFVSTKSKKYRNLSYAATLLILFFDYGFAFCVDFALGSIDGYELVTAVYLFLNLLVRAASYVLTFAFAENIVAKSKVDESLPIPFFSKSNSISKSLLIVFVVRILPSFLFEIYSNITGIIEYGFDMTGADVLSIISAYAEIILSGVLVYVFAYLFLVLFLVIDRKKENIQ